MEVEKSYDKVVLTHHEVQEALKKAIESKLNRRVRGDVHVSCNEQSLVRGLKEGEKCRPNLVTSGFAWLEAGNIVTPPKHGLDIS